MGIVTWHKRPAASKDIYINPYLLTSKCVVLLPLSKKYSNAIRSKIKTLTNKMLQVLDLPSDQLAIISIYMDDITGLIGEPEQQIIVDYLQQNKTQHILSFLATSANAELNINNIDVNITEIIHPEIVMQQPVYKASVYESLLGVQTLLS
jgi:hypothetical protein